MKRKLVFGISGSSGSVYAYRLLNKLSMLREQWSEIGIVMSQNALINWEIEIKKEFAVPDGMKHYGSNDFKAPFASGSAQYDTMIVCPCSMGTLARISTGISNDLITRAADVILKEKRKLILVPRETPLSLIHLRNMTLIAECGGLILPAIPSFYHSPNTIDELIDTVIDRVLDHAGFNLNIPRWGEA